MNYKIWNVLTLTELQCHPYIKHIYNNMKYILYCIQFSLTLKRLQEILNNDSLYKSVVFWTILYKKYIKFEVPQL